MEDKRPVSGADSKAQYSEEQQHSIAQGAGQLVAKGTTRFNVPNDGFVQLVDFMGSDAAVVQAARVSYGAGTTTYREDRALIRYLMRHRHTTPFEMCEVKLLVRVPMDTWRQWIRHRTASVNEYSTRYSEAIDGVKRTQPSEWRTQSARNKQGSAESLGSGAGAKWLSKRETQLHAFARQVYSERLNLNVAREQARKDLPLSTYTEAYWKMDLHNLLHFLELRMDAHAQLEIRQYATAIGEKIVAPLFPLTWAAFVDYRLQGVHLSRMEYEAVQSLLRGDNPESAYSMMSSRERLEFEDRFSGRANWIIGTRSEPKPTTTTPAEETP